MHPPEQIGLAVGWTASSSRLWANRSRLRRMRQPASSQEHLALKIGEWFRRALFFMGFS